MKIGILTLHYSKNYGAVLQAYALCEFLKVEGHDVKIINYSPAYAIKGWKTFINPLDIETLKKNIEQRGKPYAFKRIMQIVKYDLLFINRMRKYKKYEDFANRYLNLSAKMADMTDLSSELGCYDAIICGSDQVWNPNYINGYDPVYFLDFKEWEGIRISYAASSGIKNVTKTVYWNRMRMALKKFDLITVREQDLSNELIECGFDTEVVVDPTLLIDKSLWNGLVKNNLTIKPFILVYSLGNNRDLNECIQQLKNKIAPNIDIIDISPENHYFSAIRDTTCGPLEFLEYIKNAEYIVTDSFHGTIFSILFEKKFWCIKRDTMFSRLETLLQNVGLSDRIFTRERDECLVENINYIEPCIKLDELRKFSRHELCKILKS